MQRSVPVTRAEQSEDADRAAGRHVLPDLHHCPVRRVLHASPGRPLHRVLLPRGHHHPLRHRAQGDNIVMKMIHNYLTSFLQDRLGTGKIIAALLLLSGVVLVCKPPFLFHSYSHKELMTVSIQEVTLKEY